MTVEQLWTGSPTSPTVEPEKPTKEKRFLDDFKKLQENLKKTLDNVAIVEEERMEAAGEAEKEEKPQEPQTPVRSEWPSDTPVLCQQSGGKPGVTFTSAKGEVFSVLEWAPDSHAFKKMEFQPAEAKKFFSTVRKEMALLATSLPDGIMVKTFEDRMDLFSAMIKGPTRTPYEDGLFLFDIQLPNIYPAVPPLFRYLSQCSGRLNPNLYDNGKVCVSLLGTWIGKGTERWTSKSSLLQVLISIQGLILVNEPYMPVMYWRADPEQRPRPAGGLREQPLLQRDGADQDGAVHDAAAADAGGGVPAGDPRALLRQRVEAGAPPGGLAGAARGGRAGARGHREGHREGRAPEFPLLEEGVQAAAHSSPGQPDPRGGGAGGLGPEPSTTLQQDLSQHSDCDGAAGYPDIGFPLFPLSKGFVKSVRGVLLHYRAALAASGLVERPEDK
ncbi:hypothetical protein ANANG_G00029410 [Anguilla anguilla]|uniref:UBC core domain-containing protein n=1 Tax=Anguilla anguilla TaxID=7936 RepID=A0A9D3S8D7_ANGAN|nr:hypothetical protein ANANG_G00029410 [Anguilla anguilla]